MIRCVRIWTGDDENSYFEEGVIDLEAGARGDMLSRKMATTTISFEIVTSVLFCWSCNKICSLWKAEADNRINSKTKNEVKS